MDLRLRLMDGGAVKVQQTAPGVKCWTRVMSDYNKEVEELLSVTTQGKIPLGSNSGRYRPHLKGLGQPE